MKSEDNLKKLSVPQLEKIYNDLVDKLNIDDNLLKSDTIENIRKELENNGDDEEDINYKGISFLI